MFVDSKTFDWNFNKLSFARSCSEFNAIFEKLYDFNLYIVTKIRNQRPKSGELAVLEMIENSICRKSYAKNDQKRE